MCIHIQVLFWLWSIFFAIPSLDDNLKKYIPEGEGWTFRRGRKAELERFSVFAKINYLCKNSCCCCCCCKKGISLIIIIIFLFGSSAGLSQTQINR